MTKVVVFRTKGKLDLRSITVFGLNSKPNTDSPIGFFGTGLKYAVAVLARLKIPMSMYIDGKLWVIEQDPAKFRDKDFTELYICSTTIGGLIKKRIKLPFTTELGKTWELWQVFRELECNTRDEKGETYIKSDVSTFNAEEQYGYTYIEVEGQEFLEAYLNRDQYFLPNGLTHQSSNERIQVFTNKSDYLYYRGVRIFKLKEPSVNTYNFLCQVDLTEDRTAKNPFLLELEIENYLVGGEAPIEIMRRVVTAEPKTYESQLRYEYSTRSDTFLDVIEEAGSDATEATRRTLSSDRPPERPKDNSLNWIRKLRGCVEAFDFVGVEEVCRTYRDEVLNMLDEQANIYDKDHPSQVPPETRRSKGNAQVHEDDDIPF